MAKIEVKNMWLVYGFMSVSDRPYKTIIEDGEVVGYFDDDNDFCDVRDYECLCDTKQEAQEYLQQRMEKIKQSAPDIKRTLEQIYLDGGDNFKIEDFVPDDMLVGFESYSQRKNMNVIIRRLAKAVRFRTIDVGNRSIPLDSILQVEWTGTGASCGSSVIITLTNGERITVDDRNGVEMDMVAALFGRQRNRRGYWEEEITKKR